jgi:glucokinase
MKSLGIDVGGTKILGALFDDAKKKIVREARAKTERGKAGFIRQIEDMIGELIDGEKIKNVGIGLPGILDREKGKIINMPNIPEVKNLNLADMIYKKFKVKARIENDAKCHAIGEFFHGLGKGKKDFLVLAMGTGLGGGIFIDGKLYLGRGNAGELGHINIEPEGRECSCGNRGCLEEYASGKAIKKYAKEMKLGIEDPKKLEDMARAGDEKALEIYKKVGKYLGIGASSLIKTFDPEAVIVTGSVSNAADLFMPYALMEVEKRVFFKHCEVKASKLKDGAAIGAASLFMLK